MNRLGILASSALKQRSSTVQLVRGGGHHYKGYNEPTGNFLGIPPAPPGYRRKKFWYENIYVNLFGVTWAMFFVVWHYRPKDEIDAWAQEEAMRRIKLRGENWDTEGKPY